MDYYICKKCGRIYPKEERIATSFNKICKYCSSRINKKKIHKLIPKYNTRFKVSPMPQLRPSSSEWIGKIVRHIRWGDGKVLNKRHGAYELLVEFRNGVIRWIKRNECIPISYSEHSKKPEPMAPPSIKEVYAPRSVIESLRLGIVPSMIVREFTFGRENEIYQIKRWLEDEEGGYILLVGEYGSGKSHLIEYIEALALEMGYATTICELDPNECPLHIPKRIYHKLVKNFRFKNQNGVYEDFRQFLRLVAQKYDGILENQYLRMVIDFIKNSEEREDIWNWIEGEEMNASWPKMYGYSTASNIYCNILSTLGHLAKKVMDMSGILVLLDEVETIELYSNKYQSFGGRNLARALALIASNDIALANENTLDDKDNKRKGERTGLLYCRRNPIRYIYKFPSGLKVIFSLTRDSHIIKDFLPGPKMILNLEPIPRHDRERIFEYILKRYRAAYPTFSASEEEIEKIKHLVLDNIVKDVRSFIKASIEAFDLKRFHPNIPIGDLLK